MSAVVLLPCPFCGDDGDKGRQTVTQMTGDRNVFDRILCRCCGAMAPEANWQQRASTETKHEEAQTVEPVAWDEILGAVARGWCAPENACKTMDAMLAIAIGREVEKLLTHPAPPQPAPMSPQSNLNDPRFTTILFSVLVKRLGGTVTVTQDDIDAVAYNRLEEEGREDGTIVFRFIERGHSS